MAKVKLTRAIVEGARGKATPYWLRDSAVPGLMVRVQPTGSRTFHLALKGKHSSVVLGRYPEMTLEAARTQAHERLGSAEHPVAPKREGFAHFIEGDYAKHVTAVNKAGKATISNLKAQWVTFFKDRPLSSVSEIDIARFKAQRKEAGISAVTINRDLDRLRAALNVAVEWKVLRVAPKITKLKAEGSTRVRFLSKAEEKRLRAALKVPNVRAPHLRPLVLLAMNTGCRRGELLSLMWGNVDTERAQLRVTSANSKTGKTRYVPINPEAMGILRKLPGERRGLLFPSATGRSLTHFKRSWAALTAQAELMDFHFHDLRHHFASMLVQRGVDLYTVGNLLGHSGTEMTQRYAHLDDAHLARAVRKLTAVR